MQLFPLAWTPGPQRVSIPVGLGMSADAWSISILTSSLDALVNACPFFFFASQESFAFYSSEIRREMEGCSIYNSRAVITLQI